MASPITVTTTATELVAFNKNREEVFFQNTGAVNVYVKKQIPGALVSTPSSTNYDFILYPASATESDLTGIETTASFYAVAASATSTVAVMETVKRVIV